MLCGAEGILHSVQFSALTQHTHIEGMGEVTAGFEVIAEEIRSKPYDLLDASKDQFDRDFLEFNVNINDLEDTLQVPESPRTLYATQQMT